MAQYLKLRVIVGNDDYRRLDLDSGMPETLAEFHNTICQAFGIETDFRIQFMDPDFNNESMNVTSLTLTPINDVGLSLSSLMQNAPSTSGSCGAPVSNQASPIFSQASLPSKDDTIILPHSDYDLRSHAWPCEFPIPRFPYNVEVQLQRGNDSFRETGTQLNITPGLKSDILEKLAEEFFQYTAYLQNYQTDDVAEALILFEGTICHWLLWLDD
ncbi:uncharacterized protein LOC122873815 [Tachysurus ichikawai]